MREIDILEMGKAYRVSSDTAFRDITNPVDRGLLSLRGAGARAVPGGQEPAKRLHPGFQRPVIKLAKAEHHLIGVVARMCARKPRYRRDDEPVRRSQRRQILRVEPGAEPP